MGTKRTKWFSSDPEHQYYHPYVLKVVNIYIL